MSSVLNAILRLVDAGFPRETAEKIVMGDLPMDTASRMARAREQGFDVDTRYYHGTPYAQGVAEEGFSPRFLGKGHDEYGPGFYFSDDPRLASGYARETRAKGDGREVSPGMIEAFLRSNPLQIISEGVDPDVVTGIPLKLTQQSAEEMIEKAPGVRDVDGPLSNFFEPSSPEGYTQSDISKVAREYAGDDADYLLNDLYRGDSQSFLDALTDVTGVDSVDVFFPEFPLSSVKTVFRPDQIRSPYAAFDPDQIDSPNLMAGLGPAAIGAGLLGAAMAPEEAEAAGFGTLARAIGRPTQRLFQGSPSKFARPSMQSVGTGTGNQAFGYGLYFTDAPDIAGTYKRGLSNKKMIQSIEDQGLVPGVSAGELDDMIDDGVFGEAETRFLRALQDTDYLGFDNAHNAAMVALKRGDLAKRYDAAGDPAVANLDKIANELGFLYEVEVPEGNFIEWDLPLDQQPEVVQQVVKQNASPELKDRIESGQFKGLEAYYLFGKNPEVNSMMWAQYGVPGVRYSAVRTKEGKVSPDSPRNYVIFDENLINIVRRNDEALENNFDELAARASATDIRKPLAAILAAGAAGATQAGQDEVPAHMLRLDGTIKSKRGFLGPIRNNVSGKTMTEVSVGQPGSEEGFYPLLVPTLTPEEVQTIANLDLERGERPPFSIIEKARAHAMERIDRGLSPFYQDGEDAPTMMPAPEGAASEDNVFGAYDPAAVNLIDQQLAELQQRSRGQAGRTQSPQIDSITGADVLGGLEAAGTIGSALLGAVPAGLEGLFKLARTGDVREAGDRVEEIQRALMYEPRTEEGMRALEAAGGFLEPLGALGPFLGENVLEVTGSPELATLADVFAPDPTQIIPGLAGLKVLSSALPPIRVGRRTARPAPEGTRAHNLPSPLLVQGPGGKPATPVVQTFTPANTEKVLEQIETVKANNPSALSSTTNWLRMEGEAFGGDFLPAPPMRAIQYSINPEALATELRRLTPELKAGVDEGFEYVKQIRNVYNSAQADPTLTGRLFTWGILSRGAGPVQQEAAFIDLLDNAQPFIEKAARGEFTEADIDAWTAMVSRSLPEGSPAKQVTMNANAAGRLLFELGKKPGGSDQTVLQQLHGILSDPNRTGREFRREFFRLTDKPGIDNKVVSFIGMVAGKDDLLIMDRIQTRNLWDDGRFEGANIYDGIREGNAKGGFNAILAGPRGLLVTEALEDGLVEPVRRAYEIIGRPEDASLARMHWETWNIGGNQAVSHSTLQNVRTGTSIGGAVTEGKRGTFSSGVTYRQAINGPITEYPLSDGSFVRMTPERQKEFEAFIKNPKNGIVPKGFKVSSAQDRPWYEMPGINREKLDETARRFENANADGSLQSGARRVVEGGSTVSERRGGFLRALRGDRLAQQLAGRSGGLDSRGPSFTYQGKIGTDDEGARLLILEPSEEVASRYQFAGLSVPTLRQQPVDSQVEYVASMRAALEDNPAREQVYIPEDPNELAGARFFRTDNGSGFAIKEDGDVTAVFTDPSEPGGSSYSMLEAAVQAGGRKLDAFDTYLPKIYETVGFRPVARLRWDDSQAPPGWDKAKYAEHNDGEPDVVFFVFDPAYQGRDGAKNVPYVDTYDQGMDVQNAEMARISPEVEAYLRQARPAESSGVASLDPEPMAAGGPVRRPMPPAGIDALKAYQLRL